MPYNPSLDVLRVLAVTLVMGLHCGLPSFDGGWIGVDLFFVLSGYLITNHLFAEHQRTGQINIPRFWLKRLRRLTPALFALAICYLFLSPFIWPETNAIKVISQAAVSAVYLMDYWLFFHGPAGPLLHTWSLAVEEHFYLVWPLFLIAILKAGKHARACMLIVIGIAMIVRWKSVEMGFGWNPIYFATHTRLTGLLLGSAAAIFCRRMSAPPVLLMILGVSMFIGAKVLIGHERDVLEFRYPMIAAEAGALFMILACVRKPNILSATRLAPLGKYTYGIYLWHYPFIMAVLPAFENRWLLFVLASVVSILFAMISFHTVERIFRDQPAQKDGLRTPEDPPSLERAA